ncbi:hypothetical protein TRFO_19816 [Tritrichomonas foetus]|uniref:BEACH domain-containing protein n=1 Tax=Tritrichomonas foetus TaxID=1144522 RepID=A0A1J4KHE2_9EUKA|nr:hypothetical protein TRFO_19816 [Tritrichomonas foetus]|eukprot:OHT10831.1 hypothetical protein TRFO_19816 [Tritrichomonas foetus]
MIKAFFGSKQTTAVPSSYIDLVTFRSKTPINAESLNSNELKLISAIPSLENKDLAKLHKMKTLNDILKITAPKLVYDSQILSTLISKAGSQTSDAYAIIVCYQIFLWLFDQKKSVKETNIELFLNSLIKITIVNNYGVSQLQLIINYLFGEILNIIVNIPNFQWSDQLYKLFISYFKNNLTLDSSNFQNFAVIMKQILGHGSEPLVESCLTLIDNLIVQNASILNSPDNGILVGLIQPHIQALRPISLHILAHLAAKSTTVARNISESFIIIASSFLNVALKQNFHTITIPDDNDPVISEVSSGSQINYQFLDDFEFVPYFTQPPFEFYNNNIPCSNLVTIETKDICKSISICLKGANKEYKKQFETTFLHNIGAISNSGSAAFGELTAAFLLLFDDFASSDSFQDDTIPMLVNTNIFHKLLHVFHEEPLDKCINSFREALLEHIYRFCPNNIHNLLKQIESKKFVYIEFLTRILNHVDWFPLNTLGTNQFYITLMKLSKELQNMNMKDPNSTIIKKARNSLFIFMTNLALDQQASPYYISSQAFSLGYLVLIFESSLTNDVLFTIRNSIAKMKPEHVNQDTFAHVIQFLRNTINSCRTKCHLEKYQILARNIATEISTAIAHNCSFSIYFSQIIIPFLKNIQTFPDETILSSMLRMLTIYATVKNNYELNGSTMNQLYLSINKVNGQNPSVYTENMLFCLLRGCLCTQSDSPFLISTPSVLPLILAAFGQSNKAMHIIELIKNLCEYSDYNKVMCHIGDVDLILLKYICSRNDEKPIVYRGCEFSMHFEKEDIFNTIIPLISLISTAKSNSSDAHYLIEHLVQETDFELCSFLTRLVSKRHEVPRTLFSLGPDLPQFSIDGIVASDLENGLTISFLLYIDRECFKESNSNVSLLSIYDSNNEEFSLYVNQVTLYAKHEGESTKETVHLVKNITGGVWNKITICVSFTQEKVQICNYINDKKLSDSELSPFFFANGVLKLVVGGTDNKEEPISEKWYNRQLGKIGNIQIFKNFFEKDEVLEMHKDPLHYSVTPFISSNRITKAAYETVYTFPRDDVASTSLFGRITDIEIHVHNAPPAPLSIVDILEMRRDCNNLCAFFKNITNIAANKNDNENKNEEITQYAIYILDLIRQLFIWSLEAQKQFDQINTILGGLFEHSEILNSCLYYAFYNVMNCISIPSLKKAWFDAFILNTWLWSKCDYNEFMVIIYHYSHILILENTELFETDNYFSSLLNQTMLLFMLGDDGKPETIITEVPLLNSTYTEKAILHCQELFLIFLARIGTINLTDMDIAALFAHVSNWKTKKTLIKLLKLVFDISAKLVTVEGFKDVCIPCLYTLLNYEDIDIIKYTLLILPELSKKNKLNHLIFASQKITSPLVQQNVFDVMLNHFTESPNLFVILCIFALNLKGDNFAKLGDAFEKAISANVTPVTTPLWFITPLLIALNSPQPVIEKACRFIAHVLIKIENWRFANECNKLFSFMMAIFSLMDKWNTNIPFYLINSMVNVKNSEKAASIASNSILISLFKTWNVNCHKILRDQFEGTDFIRWMAPFTEDEHYAKYKEIENFEFILNNMISEDIAAYNIIFNITLDDNTNSVSQTLVKILNRTLSMMVKATTFSEKEIGLIVYFSRIMKIHKKSNSEPTSLSDKNVASSENLLDNDAPNNSSNTTNRTMNRSSSINSLNNIKNNTDLTNTMYDAYDIIEEYKEMFQGRYTSCLTSGIEDIKRIDDFIHKCQMLRSTEQSEIAECQMRAEYRCHLDNIPKNIRDKSNRSMFDQIACYGFSPFKVKSILSSSRHNEQPEFSELVFEHAALLMSFNKPSVPVSFRLNKKNIVIYANSKNRIIKLNSIEYILPRCSGNGAEFILNTGKTYLINFQTDFILFTKALTHIQLPNCKFILKSETINAQNIQKLWVNGFVSNFDYILQLNTFAGRSYRDKLAFPIFPSVLNEFDDLESVKTEFNQLSCNKIDFDLNIRQAFSKSEVIRADFYFRPESIDLKEETEHKEVQENEESCQNDGNVQENDKLPKWAKSNFEVVLKLRQILESDEVTKNLHKWIDYVFVKHYIELGCFPIFRSEHPPRQVLKPAKSFPNKLEALNPAVPDIKAAVGISDDTILTLSRNGSISLIKLITLPSLQVYMNLVDQIENFRPDPNSIFGHTKGRIVLFSKDSNRAWLIGDNKVISNLVIYPEVNTIACSGNDIYYCPDACSIAFVPPGSTPISFAHLSSRILNIVADDVFHVLVASTNDGYVHIFNIPGGRLVKKVQIGDEINKMIITPKWGMIVVLTDREINVFTINGLPVQKIKICEPILNWYAYSTKQSFDHIVYENINNKIGYFNPADKNTTLKLFYETREPLPLITFDPKTNCFVFISESKQISFVPHP